MEQSFVRQTIVDRMRRHGENVDQAAEALARGMNVPYSRIAPVVDHIRREGRKNMLLDSPPGVVARSDGSLEAEARLAGWYTGPEEGDTIWPRLRAKLEAGSMANVIDEIDQASTKVVAHLADPHIQNLSKRGLVLGYVQSGKTANYTAVMAKAADAGYHLFIVMSGLHNNLRRQTQVRLDKDIVDNDWLPLTNDQSDFGYIANGAAILNGGVKSLAVVKKNQSRLRRLRDWLRQIPIEIRRRTPILLLDDEADQATPNSATSADQMSRINELIREIWAEIPTGTYVGYTATPFANIFMNPNDDEELYPADFIIDLPRPTAYFGAERIFGREPLFEGDNPDPGLDMIRSISDDDAASLRPPSARNARASFDPELPASIEEAVRWFLLATAIRRSRGQRSHSSMLVHTTHYVQPHFAMRDRLAVLLKGYVSQVSSGDTSIFRSTFETESKRASEAANNPVPDWMAVEAVLLDVIAETRVVVDNGASEDRLDYNVMENGQARIETVIAVGGGTLSRGLTLEGLIVSYFTRTSNTYDTLLQMGRWFGYRVGYEDLPRIWIQQSLADEFRFLALVEEEIRQDLADMEREKRTPREVGVRVRAHPGRLAIVARNKMQHTDMVSVSYAGKRLQTFIFDEHNRSIIDANHTAVKQFVQKSGASAKWRKLSNSRWTLSSTSSQQVISLLQAYQFHSDQAGMRSDHMIGWIERSALDSPWNVVIIGSSARYQREDGTLRELGAVDVGIGERVPSVNRAPLAEPDASSGIANIKALMSHADWFADLDRTRLKSLSGEAERSPRYVRRQLANGHGLVAIYPISQHSIPLGNARKPGSRRDLDSPGDLLGIGLIFPEVGVDGVAEQGSYYSVRPDWEWQADAIDEEFPEDSEGSLDIDGEEVIKSR